MWGGGGDELTGDKSSMITGWIYRRISKSGSWSEERCVHVCMCVCGGRGGGLSGDKSPMIDGWIFRRIT